MNKHTVFVAGKKFVLLSEDSTDYVTELAKEVNGNIKRISEENPTMESRSCAILCALDYADDKKKEVERSKHLSDNGKTVMLQSDKHAKQIKELKEKLAKREKEEEKLAAENSEQKAKIEKLLKDNKKYEETNIKLTEENCKLVSENKKLTKIISKADKAEKSTDTQKEEITEKSQNIHKAPPVKKEKRHSHPHVNPYKQQAMKKTNAPEHPEVEVKTEAAVKENNTDENINNGYKPIRQISLFDNE